MKVIHQSVYAFDKANAPVCSADVGEVLLFQPMDCFSNKLVSEEMQIADVLATGFDVANPAAGPVYINGAEPGDVLAVDILDIRVADVGTVGTMAGCGPLADEAELRVKKVAIKDGFAEFNGVKFPIDPMIGVIGTAPAGEPVMCGSPGLHGGNMDSKLIRKGARVYFPVQVPGALLQMGDIHAAMGDAELCGTGVEIPGEILVKTSLIKNFELNMPVTETATHWWVNACAMDYEETLKIASEELCRLLMNVTGWDKTDTYMYMSIQSDVQINQACKPCSLFMDLRFGTPKLAGFKPLIG
ncbi:MAG: acetamidase/formamidase family protein [Clostridia bacterium]|nr:acetamidase/formamidase family protein [Clostridia bacterium]